MRHNTEPSAEDEYQAAIKAPWNWPNVWVQAAECRGTGAVIEWLPDSIKEQRALTQICRTCPVRKQCLLYALETKQCHGVWGGLTERQLRRAGSLSPQGNRQPRPGIRLNCPWCSSTDLEVVGVERLHCRKCDLRWPGLLNDEQKT